jgi:hypothetical protein
MTAERPQKDDAVAEAVADAMMIHPTDVQKATAHMLASVRASRKLRDALTEPLLRSACYDAIRAAYRRERRVIWTAPGYDASQGADRAVSYAQASLLDFRLPHGTRLGDATRADIAEAEGLYRAQADDMAHKGRWLALIAQGLPADQKVSAVYDDARLRDLQKEAANG